MVGRSVHLTPSGLDFDEHVFQLGQGTVVRAAGSLIFPRYPFAKFNSLRSCVCPKRNVHLTFMVAIRCGICRHLVGAGRWLCRDCHHALVATAEFHRVAQNLIHVLQAAAG